MESYDIVTDMIDLQSVQTSDFTPVVGHQVRYVTVAGIIAGLASVVIGAIGFVGQMTKSSTRICVFSLGSLLLLFVAAWRLLYSFTSVPLLDATVDQQITEWCLPENRLVYSAKLGCPSRHHPHFESQECGPECMAKVHVLRDMGGCRFLNRICEDYSFDFVGKGVCLAEGQDGQLVPAPYRKGDRQTTSSCCRLECNLMTICRGYSFHMEREVLNWHGGEELQGTCYVMTPDLTSGLVESPNISSILDTGNASETLDDLEEQEPRRLWTPAGTRKDIQFHNELKEMFLRCKAQVFVVGKVKTWDRLVPVILAGSNKHRQTTCWKKGRPRIVQEALDGSRYSSIISGVNTLLLTLATITGLFYQYSLATKRRGRKGLAFVLRQMLCPCLGGNFNRARKISSDDFSSESDGSTSRSSSSSEIL